MPLKHVLDHGAVLAYKVGGEEIPTGAQVWMPGTVSPLASSVTFTGGKAL